MIKKYLYIHKDYLTNTLEIIKEDKINKTIEFVNAYGYEALKHNTCHKKLNIGDFRARNRALYKKLETEKEKEEMRKEYDDIHKDFLLEGQEVRDRDNLITLLDFVEANGYEMLESKTTYNNKGIGEFRATKRKKFKALKCDMLKAQLIEEFSMLPISFLGEAAVRFTENNQIEN
ncbi:hypothetical protein [Sulfurimonas sp.]|uniref:hypothetical protein n=1 Tax=Sulfurimonas sp. TaxID=2022749 RepID=UPI0025F8A7E6|nr:hypothetical protein [Sulfurimonas sp.]